MDINLAPDERIDSLPPLNLKLVILCGGLGTRLEDLTLNTPKVLMQINNRKVIDFSLDWAGENNIAEINTSISLYHFSEQVHEYVENQYKKNNYMFSLQHRNLGTAGALKVMQKWLSPIFIVVNGDTITNVPLSDMLIYHFKYNPIVTVFTHDDAIHSGGVYIFDKGVLDLIPKDKFWDIKNDLMPLLVKSKNKIGLFKDLASDYLDIGTKEKLKVAREIFK